MGEPGPVLLEVRERRGAVGRIVRRTFFGFQLAMCALLLGTCVLVDRFVTSPDPEVAAGASLFGLMATGVLWLAWPFGTAALGLLLLLTRGRKRLIAAPPADTRPPELPTSEPPS